jgi:acyl-CoA thioesterase YciA
MSSASAQGAKPRGELAVRTLAMPADANPVGDIFGGWVLSQMDIAGAIIAGARARGRTVTVNVQEMSFHRPVSVGDVLCCYAEIIKVGKTSMQVRIEAWALKNFEDGRVMVTEGLFTYVAIDDQRKPRPVPVLED